ncbi:MAG: DoxX family protein [Leucobacter sp.]
MILIVPLIATVLVVRIAAGILVKRGVKPLRDWVSWEAATAAGMAVVYIFTSVTHFVEPQRSGLVAIIPPFIPAPELVVTLTGFAELVLAAGLLIPKTRRWAALASIALLIAMFPANIIAASGVDNPAAPSTALGPRIVLQLIFIGCSALVFFNRVSRRPDRTARLSNWQRESSQV